MSTEKSLALVLRVIDFSETSVVSTLFTRDFGKIQGLAKGARRPKGPFESALDLLCLCRLVFVRKSSDALDLLTEAKLERRFRAAESDLSRLYAGYYVAELLDELTDNGDPHPELFDLACHTLAALDGSAGNATAPVAALVLVFELSALRILGHLPQLEQCVECGTAIQPQGRVAFGMLTGGVLCARCRPGKSQVVSLTQGAWQLLRQMSRSEQGIPTTDPDRRAYGEVRGVINQYLSHLLGRRPRMHEYLGILAN